MEQLSMPAEIAGAIVGVNQKVKTLIKDHTNQHGRYKYVSYDTFLEDVGPLLAEAGLIIVMNERESMTDGKWLSITFEIYVYHSSGKCFGPMVRSQAVMANGPQAYAACQSFVEKYFMRQLFKIPTGEGEIDADASPKGQLPVSKPKASFAELQSALFEVGSKDELLAWAKATSEDRAALPMDDKARITKAYKILETKLEGATV